MATTKLFLAGSGGQGIILMGQIITYAAMHENKETTFLPSYGPEMRGGTANCTVIVSDRPISCPLIYEADIVAAMNLPSMIRFESLVKPGGKLFLNSSVIDKKPEREDISVYECGATDKANAMNLSRSANIIMLGELIRNTGVVSPESIEYVLSHKIFVGKRADLLEANLKAFRGE